MSLKPPAAAAAAELLPMLPMLLLLVCSAGLSGGIVARAHNVELVSCRCRRRRRLGKNVNA